MDNPIAESKISLTREQHQELNLYLFIIREGQHAIPQERQIGILAFNESDAMRKAIAEANGLNATYHGQFIPVKDLINRLYLEQVVSPPVSGYNEVSTITPEQFVYNLEYATKDIIKDEKLKKRLLKDLTDCRLSLKVAGLKTKTN